MIKKNWPFLMGLVLVFSLLWPLLASPYFSHHDDVQVIRLHQMNECFKDLQLPCRWVPDLGDLYGYPLFNYYAPLAYYWGELFYLLTGSLLISVKVMFASAFIGSYIFMYLLARKFWGELGGSLSAIFYSFAPYHALLLFVRGAMAELWGVMFFPAILWAIVRLKEKTDIFNAFLVSLFIALLMLSHNLSAMIFIPIAVLFGIFLKLSETRPKEIIKDKFPRYLGFSLVLAVMLSAFYFLPAVFEKNLVHVETTTYGYFSYTEHFKGLKKLFLDRSWGWGGSVREVPGGEKDGMSFQIGWVHIIGWIIALFVLFKLKKDKKNSLMIVFSVLVILFTIFMIHPRSDFIWKLIEPLKFLQFPWRLLSIIMIFISFVVGSVFLIINNKYQNRVWVVLVIMVVGFNFGYFRPEKFLNMEDKDFFVGKEWERQITRSILDFLPIYAQEPPPGLAENRYEILTGDAQVNNFTKGSNWFDFNIDVGSHTILRISQYYFPNWKIEVNGVNTAIDYNNHFGLMTLILGEGSYHIQGRLYDTPVRTIGNWVSLSSLILVMITLVFQFKRAKQWFFYYIKRVN